MAWVAPAMQVGGAVAGAIGGGKGGGGGMPRSIKKLLGAGSGILRQEANRDPATTQAAFNPDQQAAFGEIRAAQGFGQGDMATAQGRANSLAANGITGADIQKFQDPYQQQVIDAAMRDIEQARGQRRLGANSEAEAAGAFGGDRNAVYNAVLDGEYDRTGANTIAGLRSNGFNAASGLAMQNAGLQMTGNDQLMNMINQRRQAMYGDAQALGGVGDLQQQRQQAILDYRTNMATKMLAGAGANSGYSQPQGGGISGIMQGMLGGSQIGGQLGGMLGQYIKPGATGSQRSPGLG